jgi:hypothetical protein
MISVTRKSGVARTPVAKESTQPLKRKAQNRDAWIARRKQYLLANGRVEEYHREFGHE